jgi:hypothetical protein
MFARIIASLNGQRSARIRLAMQRSPPGGPMRLRSLATPCLLGLTRVWGPDRNVQLGSTP